MAPNPGRGAQVRLDTEAQKIARGAGGLTLAQSLEAKMLLDLQGNNSDGYTPDGSTPLGGLAEDEVLAPGGLIGDITDIADVVRQAVAEALADLQPNVLQWDDGSLVEFG